MQLRVLGCSGAIAQGCRTTAFRLGERLLVDAGTGVGELRMDELLAIDHVLLTHSHLDHIAALPLMLDAVGAHRHQPLQVHALPATLAALRQHIFNGTIWPDFTRIPTPAQPFVQLQPLALGQRLQLAGLEIEVLPARHSVPAVGYAVRGTQGWWIYSGDTGGEEPAFWQRVHALAAADGVAALFIETAFSNQEQALARTSGHLAPASLARELQQLGPGAAFPIYITHAKPRESQRIMREVQALEQGAFTLIDLQTVDALEL
ncbi:MAG: 3',5'-cyclic-nucleotide phosphodiesterase [Comamonadaceae bacterium]|nr:3',5'-cyclic-nucleotide phosphodiesterase [Comamonadaceae bacterium]